MRNNSKIIGVFVGVFVGAPLACRNKRFPYKLDDSPVGRPDLLTELIWEGSRYNDPSLVLVESFIILKECLAAPIFLTKQAARGCLSMVHLPRYVACMGVLQVLMQITP